MTSPMTGTPTSTDGPILVTGGTGFIGSALVRSLVRQGHHVHVLSQSGIRRERLTDLGSAVTIHPADVLDPASYGPLLDELTPGLCFHLAWYVEPGTYLESPLNLEHLGAGLVLLERLFATGCKRVLVAGTCYEYEDSPDPLQEDHPTAPRFLYAGCKNALHFLGRRLADLADAELIWGRIFYQYGPFEDPKRLVPLIARTLSEGGTLRLRSHGLQVRDFLHVDDVGSGLAAAGLRGAPGPINIGSGEPVRVRDLATEIRDLLGRGEVTFAPADTALNEPAFVCADSTLLRGLGWRPERSLASYLEKQEFLIGTGPEPGRPGGGTQKSSSR